MSYGRYDGVQMPFLWRTMEFDSTTQKMKCPYVIQEMEVASISRCRRKRKKCRWQSGCDAGGNNETGLIWATINGWKARQTESESMPVSPVEERSLQMPIPRNKLSVLWKQGCHERTVCRRSETGLYHSV